MGDEYREEEVVRRFAAVNDRQELEAAIDWVKSLRIEEDTVELDTPLVRAMRITGRWPGPGMYGCTKCDDVRMHEM